MIDPARRPSTAVALAALALALAPVGARADLLNVPSSPPLVQHPTPRPDDRPAPPRMLSNVVDGWTFVIGEGDAGACGRPGRVGARVVPGIDVPWEYRFVRSDGTASETVRVPGAPLVPGTRLGAKDVVDELVLRPGTTDTLQVTFLAKRSGTLSSPTLAIACR